MDPQAVTSFTRYPGSAPALENTAQGLGRIRISGALRAFLQDVRGVPVYPVAG